MSEWFKRLPDNGVVTTSEVAKLFNVSSKVILTRAKKGEFPKPDIERYYGGRKRYEWYAKTVREHQARNHEQ